MTSNQNKSSSSTDDKTTIISKKDDQQQQQQQQQAPPPQEEDTFWYWLLFPDILIGVLATLCIYAIPCLLNFHSLLTDCARQLTYEGCMAADSNEQTSCTWNATTSTCAFADGFDCSAYSNSSALCATDPVATQYCVYKFGAGGTQGACLHRAGWSDSEAGLISAFSVIGGVFGPFVFQKMADWKGYSVSLGLCGVMVLVSATLFAIGVAEGQNFALYCVSKAFASIPAFASTYIYPGFLSANTAASIAAEEEEGEQESSSSDEDQEEKESETALLAPHHHNQEEQQLEKEKEEKEKEEQPASPTEKEMKKYFVVSDSQRTFHLRFQSTCSLLLGLVISIYLYFVSPDGRELDDSGFRLAAMLKFTHFYDFRTKLQVLNALQFVTGFGFIFWAYLIHRYENMMVEVLPQQIDDDVEEQQQQEETVEQQQQQQQQQAMITNNEENKVINNNTEGNGVEESLLVTVPSPSPDGGASAKNIDQKDEVTLAIPFSTTTAKEEDNNNSNSKRNNNSNDGNNNNNEPTNTALTLTPTTFPSTAQKIYLTDNNNHHHNRILSSESTSSSAAPVSTTTTNTKSSPSPASALEKTGGVIVVRPGKDLTVMAVPDVIRDFLLPSPCSPPCTTLAAVLLWTGTLFIVVVLAFSGQIAIFSYVPIIFASTGTNSLLAQIIAMLPMPIGSLFSVFVLGKYFPPLHLYIAGGFICSIACFFVGLGLYLPTTVDDGSYATQSQGLTVFGLVLFSFTFAAGPSTVFFPAIMELFYSVELPEIPSKRRFTRMLNRVANSAAEKKFELEHHMNLFPTFESPEHKHKHHKHRYHHHKSKNTTAANSPDKKDAADELSPLDQLYEQYHLLHILHHNQTYLITVAASVVATMSSSIQFVLRFSFPVFTTNIYPDDVRVGRAIAFFSFAVVSCLANLLLIVTQRVRGRGTGAPKSILVITDAVCGCCNE